MGIFRRIALGWELGMASCRVLFDNKILMIFPLMSLFSTAVTLAVFATGGAILGLFTDLGKLQGPSATMIYFIGLFLVYTVFNTITIFFNVALLSCASRALSAHPPRVGKGLADAFARIPYILMWAAISSTISIVLNIIERQKWIGKIVALILGGVWSILTYLVLPVIAYERISPFKAIKRSSQLIIKTWGEGLGGRIGVGLISFLMILPAFLMFAAAIYLSMPLILVVGIVWACLVLLWAATANTILQVAIYAYARDLNLRTDYFQNLDGVFYSKGGGSDIASIHPGKMEMFLDKEGDTDLHNAIDRGNLDVVDIMIKRGANLWAKGLDGKMPYERAVAIGQNEIAERLRQAMEERGQNPFEK